MFSLLLGLISSVFYINNNDISLGVGEETQAFRAGSITHLYDNYSSSQIAGFGQFSGINSGSYIPANGDIEVLNDTTLVFHTDHLVSSQSSLPVDLTITYRIVNRGLEIAYRFEYLENVEFWDPLEIDFCIDGWDNISISNQTSIDEEFALNGTTGFQRFSGDQMFRISDGDYPDAIFVLPNTSKGIVVVNDDTNSSYMTIRVLDTEVPRETATGPDLHSIIGEGQVDEYFIRFSMDEYFAPIFLGGHPDGAERTSAWILDEIPFLHPGQGVMWAYSETSEGDEAVSAALISLLDDHPTMKMNWIILPDAILTPNRDSVWFEPGYEDSWSHWHGTWRISTEATEDYLQWLKNIQDDIYPWADRVRMGSHGYHHTPNPDSSFGEFHEFITVEPYEHHERFRMNFLDLDDCGLDTNMVQVIRFSGHRTSITGLQAVIDHGFTFYCNGWRLIDSFAGKQFRNQWITRYHTPSGRIWGSNTVWWGDYEYPQPTEYLSEVMEKGKFGLLGCHPIAMLGAEGGAWMPECYARIDSILTSVENDYENFLWLFPGEYGDFLEDCFNIRVDSLRCENSFLELDMTGFIPEGLTVCADLQPGDQVHQVSIDGQPITWELRSGGRLFAVLPEAAYDYHKVLITVTPTGINDVNHFENFTVRFQDSPTRGFPVINVQGIPSGEMFDLRLYDITGRVIASQREVFNSSVYSINLSNPLPSGVYFVTATVGNTMASDRAVVL